VCIVGLWWGTAGAGEAEDALWRTYTGPTAMLNGLASAIIAACAYVLSSPSGARTRIAHVALVAGGTTLALVLLELPAVALGYDYGIALGTRASDTWLQLAMGVNRPDPELIYVHQPHTRYRGVATGNLVWLGIPSPTRYEVDVAYDSHGFRNDVDYKKADIVAIGDSFVEAAEIPRPQTVVAQVAGRLGAVAVNLGQSGYGPQQELVVLRRYGAPLDPKHVIWFFFGGNDLGDVDAYEWSRRQGGDLHHGRSLASRSFTRNALFALAKLTTPERRVPGAAARRHAVQFEDSTGRVETIYLDANEGPWRPRQWEVASRVLEQARDITNGIGADLLVVYIPRKLRVYRGYVRAQAGGAYHVWHPNNLPDVLGAWCREHSIDFLDSTVPLRAAVASGRSVYLPDDVHWNAHGHSVVAAAIAAYVQNRKARDEHYRVGESIE
jgi:lysophospholipase L1-like esterase